MDGPLRLPAKDFELLLRLQGPSLGLWRAAEVAVLREQEYARPIADLGCGDGLVTSLVLPYVEVGIDPWARAARRARERGLYGRLEIAQAESTAVPPGSMGTVVSNSVLEHIPRLEQVLQWTARTLRPGGRLIFTTPSETFSEWLAFPAERYRHWRNAQYRHLNLWPLDRWHWQLDRAGLSVLAVRNYLRRPLVAAWDVLELLQQVRVRDVRPAASVWRRLPDALIHRLAARAARLDLSAPGPGGGQLIVAEKR